jgi:MFS family permease
MWLSEEHHARLTVATLFGVMAPWLLLLLALALSIGDAVESPSWRPIFPELVNKEELPAARALNGIEFNLARALGPRMGGFIVAAVGVGAAFAFNAFTFLGAIAVIARWNPKRGGDIKFKTDVYLNVIAEISARLR